MRHNGILGKQHRKLVTPLCSLIFKVFFYSGEVLDYIYQFYFFPALLMNTASENQGRFFCFPENHWVVQLMVNALYLTTFFQSGVYATLSCENILY